MDWRETGGDVVGVSGIGIYYFFGGILLLVGSIGEVRCPYSITENDHH
jgi:hypothetical protein